MKEGAELQLRGQKEAIPLEAAAVLTKPSFIIRKRGVADAAGPRLR